MGTGRGGGVSYNARTTVDVAVSINGTAEVLGCLEITQEVEMVASLFASKPDPTWEHTDDAGHYHAWTGDGKLPTLEVKVEHKPCDGSCGDTCGGEGYTVIHYHCRICQVELQPGKLPDQEPHPVFGLKTWSLTVQMPLDGPPAEQVRLDQVASFRMDARPSLPPQRYFGAGQAVSSGVDGRTGLLRAEIHGIGELGKRPLPEGASING